MNISTLPDGWAICKLGDLIVHALGGEWGESPDVALNSAVRVHVLRGTDFKHWERRKGDSAPQRAIKPQSLAKRHLHAGDIVVEVSGGGPDQPVGRTILIDQEAVEHSVLPLICSNFCRQVRLITEVDPAFVSKVLTFQYELGEFNKFQSETTNIRNLNFPDFVATVNIPLPPASEQRRIATHLQEVLGQVKTVRERLEKVRSILKRFRQSVLAAACSGQLTDDWRSKTSSVLPAKNIIKAISDERRQATGGRGRRHDRFDTLVVDVTNSQGLREGWCVGTIGAIADCLDNQRVPVNKDDRSKREGSIPYYGANGQVGWIDEFLFDEELVLVVEDETFVGREKPFSYVIRGKSWVNNHAHVLRPLGGISVEYLNICLSYYDFVPLTSGSTGRRKLTQAALLGAPLAIAPLSEQQEIVRRVQELLAWADAVERRVEAARARVEKLTQAVLAKAFRGELVPTEAELARQEGREYEPASVLLERIRAERASAPTSRAPRKRRTARP